jgi:hypothetical protein
VIIDYDGHCDSQKLCNVFEQQMTVDTINYITLDCLMKFSTSYYAHKALSFFCLSACLSLLSACGQISYKQGGSTQDLKVVERQCRAHSTDESGYKSCMKDKGWSTMDDFSVEADKTRASSAPSPAENSPALMQETGKTQAPAAMPMTDMPMNGAADQRPPQPTPAPSVPAGMVKVASWWKLGGTADDLNDALLACNVPSDNGGVTARIVPKAILGCMKQHGWRAITQK